MVVQFVIELRRALSQERLDAYRPTDGTDLDMLVNYFWDIKLAEAISPALHAAEVALRNSIHDTLSNHYGTDMWFYQPGVLEPGQLGELSRALEQLSRRKARPTAGRIVAELTAGFWVSLLSRNYEQRVWQAQSFVLLRIVFPGAENRPRQELHQRYNETRKLRNRVFHFEAIWNRPNLLQDHVDIHESIGWINPTLQTALRSIDNFSDVYHGRARIEVGLKQRFGIT